VWNKSPVLSADAEIGQPAFAANETFRRNCCTPITGNRHAVNAVLERRARIAYHPPMSNLRIALYQPDIPGNTGTILRLAACLGLQVDIIEPAGFVLSDKNLKRAGMDYLASVAMTRHVNWDRFDAWRLSEGRRIVLASTKAALPYTTFEYLPNDILLFGRESAGVPDDVHDRADHRIIIKMVEGQRSINVAMSAAMIAGEALRQTGI
jgi:tRNA (cytidine/uridine-2'-O-)-methyltransferase